MNHYCTSTGDSGHCAHIPGVRCKLLVGHGDGEVIVLGDETLLQLTELLPGLVPPPVPPPARRVKVTPSPSQSMTYLQKLS